MSLDVLLPNVAGLCGQLPHPCCRIDGLEKVSGWNMAILNLPVKYQGDVTSGDHFMFQQIRGFVLFYSFGQNAKGLNHLTFRWSPWQTLYPSFSHLYGYQFLPTTFREDKSSSRRSNHLNHLDHSASQIGSSLQWLRQTFQQSEPTLRDTIAYITNNWRSSSHESWVWHSKLTQPPYRNFCFHFDVSSPFKQQLSTNHSPPRCSECFAPANDSMLVWHWLMGICLLKSQCHLCGCILC